MSDPTKLVVKFHDPVRYPALGTVVGIDGKVRAYPARPEEARGNAVIVSVTNDAIDSADSSWLNYKSVALTKERAMAFIAALSIAIRGLDQ